MNEHSKLDAFRPAALDAVEHDGLLWISYPKRISKVKTDLTRDVLGELMKGMSLKSVTQVSVDATWSAMRFRPDDRVGK